MLFKLGRFGRVLFPSSKGICSAGGLILGAPLIEPGSSFRLVAFLIFALLERAGGRFFSSFVTGVSAVLVAVVEGGRTRGVRLR